MFNNSKKRKIMIPVREKKLREVLKPYLSISGGIKHKKNITMFTKLMGTLCEDLVCRQVYCDILESTDKTILKIFTQESDCVLLNWLTKSLKNKELKFQKKFLKLLIKLPIDASFFENSQTYKKLQELSQNSSFGFQKILTTVLLIKNKAIKSAKMNSFRIPKKSAEEAAPPKTEITNESLDKNSPEEIIVPFENSLNNRYTSSSPMENIYQEFYPNWGEKNRDPPTSKIVQRPLKEEDEEVEVEEKFLQSDYSWLELANKAKSFEKDLKPIIKTPKSDKKPKMSLRFSENERTLTYFEYIKDERVNASRPHFKLILDKEYEGYNFFDTIIEIPWKTPALVDIPDYSEKQYKPSEIFKNPPTEPIIIPWLTPDEQVFDHRTMQEPLEPPLESQIVPHEEKMPLEIPITGISTKEFSYIFENNVHSEEATDQRGEISNESERDTKAPLLQQPSRFKHNNASKRMAKKKLKNYIKNNPKALNVKRIFDQSNFSKRTRFPQKIVQVNHIQFNGSVTDFEGSRNPIHVIQKRKQNHPQTRLDSNQNFNPFQPQLDSISPLMTMHLGNSSRFNDHYQQPSLRLNNQEDFDYRRPNQTNYDNFPIDRPFSPVERWHKSEMGFSQNNSFKIRGGQAYNNKGSKNTRGKKPQRFIYCN